jgi:N-acetylglucosaminyldiphosphoundecaprenol N-acetyl-beta-D-mannosaminyltransferase
MSGAHERVSILGVPITNLTMQDALGWIEARIRRDSGNRSTLFFANANTLNLASRDPAYRAVLRSADHVFGDGTGVRIAARFRHGVRLLDNVNGTDLIPRLLGTSMPGANRLFLLGGTPDAIERAAAHASRAFPAWKLVGFHHGYVGADPALLAKINAAAPNLLLVGMGNPKQEEWIEAHRAALDVPLCIAVGGLFAYWAGDLTRAPVWLRRIGFEWLHLMVRQPRKVSRYLLGNPAFLLRVAFARNADSVSGAASSRAPAVLDEHEH